MKLITRDTDYAIRALCYIARNKGDMVTAKDMVGGLKIPRPFLRKILQALNREGILKSHKGRDGGFTLARAPEEIFLIELMKAFQGPFKLNEHIFKNSPCPHEMTCRLKKKLDKIEGYVKSQLENITLKSLM